MLTAEHLLARFTLAKTRKLHWDRRYEDALDYAAPDRQMYREVTDGQSKADKVFDGIAMTALDAFISNLQSALFPPLKQWIALQPGPDIAEEEREEREAELREITRVMFSALRNSNFDTQISSAFADYALGVGALLVNKGTREKPFHFTAVHIGQIYLEEGPEGRVDAAYRQRKLKLRNVEATWPDADIPGQYTTALADRPDEDISVVECIVPKKIQKAKKGETATRPVDGYVYVVIDEKTKAELVRREVESSAWVIFRWPGLPEQLYPEGPLLKALPDIKVYNKVKELLLTKASRDVYGLYTYLDEGVVNIDNIQFGKTCFIPVESNGGTRGPSIAPLPPTGDLQLSQFLFNDLEIKINKTMFAEPLGRVDLPVKTATEVALRQQELAQRIGAAFGRLQYELVQPLVNRLLHILEELGLIDLSGFRADGRVISIEYMSPLAMAQDQEEFMAARGYVETVVGLYGQAGLAMAPMDKFAKYFADRLHLDTKLLPTSEEIQAMKEALLQQGIQQGAAQQQAAQGAPGQEAA